MFRMAMVRNVTKNLKISIQETAYCAFWHGNSQSAGTNKYLYNGKRSIDQAQKKLNLINKIALAKTWRGLFLHCEDF